MRPRVRGFLVLIKSFSTLTEIIDVSYNRRPWRRKGSPYSITERRVPELIPVLGSQVQVT